MIMTINKQCALCYCIILYFHKVKTSRHGAYSYMNVSLYQFFLVSNIMAKKYIYTKLLIIGINLIINIYKYICLSTTRLVQFERHPLKFKRDRFQFRVPLNILRQEETNQNSVMKNNTYIYIYYIYQTRTSNKMYTQLLYNNTKKMIY